MSTRCLVCNDPRRLEIETAMLRRVLLKDLSSQFGLSAFSLSRHRRLHLGNEGSEVPESNGDLRAQAQKWLARADQIWQTATVDADVRGQAEATRVALRGIEQLRKAQLQEPQQAPNVPGATGLTLEYLDDLMERHYTQAANDPRYRVARLIEQSASEEQAEMIERLLSDSKFFREVEARKKVTDD